jgi:F0F1-type ATP synthase assembly protein I
MDKEIKKEAQKTNVWVVFARASGLAFNMVLPLILLTGAGYILDKKFQTKPLFILIGLGLSVPLTFYILFREGKRLFKN